MSILTTRGDHTPRPRRSAELIAALAARLTARDRWLLCLLHEHKVLTTPQISDIAFGNTDTAGHRMLILYRLRAVERARPFRPEGGSAPWHWVLDTPGAEALAAEQGMTLAELGYRRDRALSVLLSGQLNHLLGVNGFFASLAAATRQRDGELVEWWPEARCAKTWGDIVRPDGYGRWQADGRVLDFFLEYDNSTEPLGRVAEKIDAYHELTGATGIVTPVLMWFASARREINFRNACSATPPIPVATASPPKSGSGQPAGAVWAPLGRPLRRHRLIDLTPPATARADTTSSEPPPATLSAASAWASRPREHDRRVA